MVKRRSISFYEDEVILKKLESQHLPVNVN